MRPPTAALALSALLASLFAAATPGNAATITADGVSCRLADAIRSANFDDAPPGSGCDDGSGDDLIVLDADVVLTSADAAAAGAGTIFGGTAGLPPILSSITIQAGLGDAIARDPSYDCEVADADAFRIFLVSFQQNLTLTGITLRNGCIAPLAAVESAGGAVYVNGGTLTVLGGAFVGNRVRGWGAKGGAVAAALANVMMSGTLLEGNGVQGGDSATVAGSGEGGAVHLLSSALTLEGCELRDNLAIGGDYIGPGGCGFCTGGVARGGALYASDPVAQDLPIVVRDSAIVDNQSLGGLGGAALLGGGASGGGLELFDVPGTLLRLRVAGNRAEGGVGENGGPAEGGGLHTAGAIGPITRESLFVGNLARGGGGVTANAGSGLGGGARLIANGGEVVGCSFVDNLARGGDASGGASLAGNGVGGGLSLLGADALAAFVNSTVSGNTARGGEHLGAGEGGEGQGGGVAAARLLPTVSHLTIADNHALGGAGGGGGGAARGGGLYVLLQPVTVDDSLLADNTVTPGLGSTVAQDCFRESGTLTSAGYNLVETPDGSCSFAATGDQTGVDPLLRPLADNGCATPLLGGLCPPTHSFPAGSPAGDAGSCTLSALTTDQRGVARPQQLVVLDADDGCDVGALELDPGSYYTVTPCRLVDTRLLADAPALSSGIARTFPLAGLCAIPDGAAALTLNVTVVAPAANGHLVLYPGDLAAPLASTLNFVAGGTRANNAIVRLATDGSATVTARATLFPGGDVHLILDVTGYFE